MVSVDAGVRIAHPRISDLVLHLVSPSGTRVLLDENRGGASTEGMGLSVTLTNATPVYSAGGAAPATNVLDTGQTSGTILIAYRFYAQPDEMWVYYDGTNIFDSGLVTTSGANYVLTNINYGPGTGTTVTIIMNENGNPDSQRCLGLHRHHHLARVHIHDLYRGHEPDHHTDQVRPGPVHQCPARNRGRGGFQRHLFSAGGIPGQDGR